jgi:hypothetical protein
VGQRIGGNTPEISFVKKSRGKQFINLLRTGKEDSVSGSLG